MKGWHAPPFTKKEVSQKLTKQDKQQILQHLGYHVIPKNTDNPK